MVNIKLKFNMLVCNICMVGKNNYLVVVEWECNNIPFYNFILKPNLIYQFFVYSMD
jgi:hypothetical protein